LLCTASCVTLPSVTSAHAFSFSFWAWLFNGPKSHFGLRILDWLWLCLCDCCLDICACCYCYGYLLPNLVFLHLYLTGYLIHHIGSGDSRAPEADSRFIAPGKPETGIGDRG
jgi:hypothetical protein